MIQNLELWEGTRKSAINKYINTLIQAYRDGFNLSLAPIRKHFMRECGIDSLTELEQLTVQIQLNIRLDN